MLTESCSMPPGVCHVVWKKDVDLERESAFEAWETVTGPPYRVPTKEDDVREMAREAADLNARLRRALAIVDAAEKWKDAPMPCNKEVRALDLAIKAHAAAARGEAKQDEWINLPVGAPMEFTHDGHLKGTGPCPPGEKGEEGEEGKPDARLVDEVQGQPDPKPKENVFPWEPEVLPCFDCKTEIHAEAGVWAFLVNNNTEMVYPLCKACWKKRDAQKREK